MTKKKILAGVLSAAMVLSVSTTAFAAPEAPDTNKEITKAGETEYEAGIGMMGAELSVELPASMKAFLNPYGAVVDVDAAATPTTSGEGIVSWAYEVVNNTENFGIMVDVKNAKATVGTGLTLKAPGAVADGASATDKQVALVLQAGATAADATKYDDGKTASAAAGVTEQGIFVFTDAAVSKSKIAYAPAKCGQTAGKVYLGLTGEINKQYNGDGGNKEDLEWTEDDTITAAYTLKINPSATNALDAFLPDHSDAVAGVLTAADLDTAATDSDVPVTIALADTEGLEYNISAAGITAGKKVVVDITSIVASGWTVDTTGVAAPVAAAGNKLTWTSAGAAATATIKLTKTGETDQNLKLTFKNA